MHNCYHYRNRIYGDYLTSRKDSVPPSPESFLRPRAAYLRKLVKDHFPLDKSSVIFEIGCGYGAIIHFAKEAGYTNVSGVDGSLEQVNAAVKLNIPNVKHADGLSELASFESNSLDTIVAFDLIEHFTRDELIGLVDEVYRVLKPEGRWIIHVPNAGSPFFGRVRYGDLTHELAFTATSLTQLLKSSRFSAVECFEDKPVPSSFKGWARLFIWLCIRSLLRLYIVAETGSRGDKDIFSQNMLAVAIK